jgi:hypothetical protein
MDFLDARLGRRVPDLLGGADLPDLDVAGRVRVAVRVGIVRSLHVEVGGVDDLAVDRRLGDDRRRGRSGSGPVASRY